MLSYQEDRKENATLKLDNRNFQKMHEPLTLVQSVRTYKRLEAMMDGKDTILKLILFIQVIGLYFFALLTIIEFLTDSFPLTPIVALKFFYNFGENSEILMSGIVRSAN